MSKLKLLTITLWFGDIFLGESVQLVECINIEENTVVLLLKYFLYSISLTA